MGFFGDLFLGAKQDMRFTPGAEQTIRSLEGMNFGIGKPAKMAKQGYKALNRGEDVSGMGQFAEIAQNEARDVADVDFNYMTGANALEGAAGGTQLNQINRMRDLAKERVREGAGRQRVSALGDLRRDLYGQWQRGIESRDQQEMWRQNALGQARGQMYNAAQRSGGILPGLIQGAAQVGSMAALACWIAEALYGETDLRTLLLRYWINNVWARESRVGALVLKLYLRFGERTAGLVRRSRLVRGAARILFDGLLRRAQETLWLTD